VTHRRGETGHPGTRGREVRADDQERNERELPRKPFKQAPDFDVEVAIAMQSDTR